MKTNKKNKGKNKKIKKSAKKTIYHISLKISIIFIKNAAHNKR